MAWRILPQDNQGFTAPACSQCADVELGPTIDLRLTHKSQRGYPGFADRKTPYDVLEDALNIRPLYEMLHQVLSS